MPEPHPEKSSPISHSDSSSNSNPRPISKNVTREEKRPTSNFDSSGSTPRSKRDMAGGGTEAFPDLGRHCQNPDCNLLDFLPFTCDGCRKVFCAEHRSCKSHGCPGSDHRSRRVVVCEACSAAIEATGEDERAALARHEGSGDCDPRRKKKPVCPVRRCREVLTFSNTSACKACGIKVCLKHRFPADHSCGTGAAAAGGRWNDKFVAVLASRGAKEYGKKERGSSSPPSTPTVKAC